MISRKGLLIASLLVPSIAFAQGATDAGKAGSKEAAKPAGSVVPSTPERTTASFGDWVLRCETIATAPSSRICEVAQAITLQGQANPIAQLAVGRQAANDPRRLTIVLPTNIAFAAKPRLSIAKAGAPIEMTWQRCAAGGCFAAAPVTDEMLGALGAQTEPGKLQFKDANDRDVALPLSFRGFSQALAALAKEQ